MEIEIHFSLKNGSAYADGIYDGKTTIVKAGGRVSERFADCIRGGNMIKSMRNDPRYVDADRYIISDCVFNSPSAAIQFVSGRSLSGYEGWKVSKKKNLGAFLKENGLR